MPFNDQSLNNLCKLVRTFANDELRRKLLTSSLEVDSIILYGSAARFHTNQVAQFGDFDLNVFFRAIAGYQTGDARRFNKRGGYWRAADFQEKEVQVIFNILMGGQNWIDSARCRTSERWQRIRTHPIVQLYPQIAIHEHL